MRHFQEVVPPATTVLLEGSIRCRVTYSSSQQCPYQACTGGNGDGGTNSLRQTILEIIIGSQSMNTTLQCLYTTSTVLIHHPKPLYLFRQSLSPMELVYNYSVGWCAWTGYRMIGVILIDSKTAGHQSIHCPREAGNGFSCDRPFVPFKCD